MRMMRGSRQAGQSGSRNRDLQICLAQGAQVRIHTRTFNRALPTGAVGDILPVDYAGIQLIMGTSATGAATRRHVQG